MTRFAASLLLVTCAAVGGAQAPVITAAGDPSVRSDSIYSLAVSADDYPEDSWIFLLDDGVVSVEPDGRQRATYRYVAQVLRQDAVEQWGEHSFSYSGARQRFTLNWMRVVSPDGTVIADGPSHQQTSGADVAVNNPVYTDAKVHRATIGGVAPGTIVDYSYTVEDIEPLVHGDFFSTWSVTTGRPVMRSRFIVEAPVAMQPRIVERNLSFRRTESERNGRRTYVWATRDVPKPEPEPFASDSNNTINQSILVSGSIDWSHISSWYAELARGRLAASPAVKARLGEIVAGRRTLADSLRAVHQWIAQDIRYVSLSLGMGGYQPRTPDDVLTTAFGDCKDKTTLFVAMARELGLQAFPVLTSAGPRVRRDAPSLRQFDHMIAAVDAPGGRTFVDLTAAYVPWGEVPFSLHEEFGLLVRDDGASEQVTIPGDPSARHVHTVVTGVITPAGEFNGRVTHRYLGGSGDGLRAAFARELTQKEKDEFLRTVSASIFTGGRPDSLEIFDGRDLTATPQVSFVVRGARAARLSGGSAILPVLFEPPDPSETISELAAYIPRKYWIAAAGVMGIGSNRQELHLTLPDGWRARLPKGVTAESEFGSYMSEYAQEGQQLRIIRESKGSRAVTPPESVNDLISWLERIGEDDATFILVDR
ncbi:MAG TPA: DUF3857 and transglutaminase domain-containing protein, partial [Gemmatimonadaceae bacterium]